jgi:hypothetical protein
MSIEAFIKEACDYDEEINDYFRARPELFVALTSDAVSIDKIFEIVPSLVALLDKYGMKTKLREEFQKKEALFPKRPSSLRLLAQVFGHPWQHVNLEQALAEAVAATRADIGCDQKGSCGDCDCEEDEESISVGIAPDGNLAYTVSDAPLTLQEEAEFIDTLRHTAAQGKTVAENDPVNHPSHYTSNASGVEAIELTEKMSFNLGNAFKYVFRRDGKGNSLQDVSKAEWYLKREIGRLEALIESTPAGFFLMMHPGMSVSDLRKADKVIAVEPNPNAADYYANLFGQGILQTPDDLSSLHDALENLQALIADIREGRAE